MYKGSSSWPHVNFLLRMRKVNTENSGHYDQWKTCKIHYLPPRALNGTTWIPRGPPSLGTCTSFTISLWDNGWMREHEHGRSTKPKQKQNKSRQNTDTHTTEENQTKTPPGDRHPSTHSGAQAWWRRQHWRTPTAYLDASLETAELQRAQKGSSWTMLFWAIWLHDHSAPKCLTWEV